MNSLRSRISFRSTTTPTSRAHLSPLARTQSFASRSSRATTLAPTPRSWPAARALELTEANHATRWWNPALLDRLEAPLTRFHD